MAPVSAAIDPNLRFPVLLEDEEEDAWGEEPREDIELRDLIETGLENSFGDWRVASVFGGRSWAIEDRDGRRAKLKAELFWLKPTLEDGFGLSGKEPVWVADSGWRWPASSWDTPLFL
jgi:hypothetical protein